MLLPPSPRNLAICVDDGALSQAVHITEYDHRGISRMGHTLHDIIIEKNHITMKITHPLTLMPGETLTLVFNGEIVPMMRSEWDALIAYRDWRSNDDPRGEGKKENLGLPQEGGRAMVQHAGAGWLRRVYARLFGVLPG